MYLHLGGETVVKTSEVIAILNLENVSLSSTTQLVLRNSVNQEEFSDISASEPKSMIITDKKIYTSPISSFTLMKRAGFFADMAKSE